MGTVGHSEQYGSPTQFITKQDADYLTKARVWEKMDKFSHPFDVVVCSGRNLAYLMEYRCVSKYRPTFVMNSGVTGSENWMPLTPWMVAHRWHHGVAIYQRSYIQSDLEIMIDAGGFYDRSDCSYEDFLSEVVNSHFARSGGRYTNSLDAEADLWARWVIHGSVKLRSCDKHDVSKMQELTAVVDSHFADLYASLCGKTQWF